MSSSTANLNSNITLGSSAVVKLVLFEVGKLTLALPILQIQKIIKQHEVHGSGIGHVHLSHLAEREVTIVDLQQKLFGVSQTDERQPGYFILTQEIAGEPLGIIVKQAPTLVDVTLEQIRQLPNSYRHADTLEIASHVTVIPQAESAKNLTVFILDLTKAV